MRSRRHLAGRRHLAFYGLALWIASLLAPAAVSAQVHFDFEGPYLSDPNYSIKDHCLFKVDDTWQRLK